MNIVQQKPYYGNNQPKGNYYLVQSGVNQQWLHQSDKRLGGLIPTRVISIEARLYLLDLKAAYDDAVEAYKEKVMCGCLHYREASPGINQEMYKVALDSFKAAKAASRHNQWVRMATHHLSLNDIQKEDQGIKLEPVDDDGRRHFRPVDSEGDFY